MSKRHDEHSSLMEKSRLRSPGYETINSIPWQEQSSSPLTSLPPSAHTHSSPVDVNSRDVNSRDPPRDRSDTMTSFGGVSLLGSEANPRDAQELLDNLDRATNLLRKHLHDMEESETRGHMTVSRPLIPRWVTKYLLLITFIWQVFGVGCLEVVDVIKTGSNSTSNDLHLASNIFMTVSQSIHLLLVFFVSFKLVKKVLHRSASGSLLAQSYLSTVLLFAGLYTLEFRLSGSGFTSVFLGSNRQRPSLLFLRMSYFSVSTATLCGTSEVEPVEWYASLTVSLQMLMSFVYFASILSLGVIPRKKTKQDLPTGKSLTQRLREKIFKNRTRS